MPNIDNNLPQKDQFFSRQLPDIGTLDTLDQASLNQNGSTSHAYYADTLSSYENAEQFPGPVPEEPPKSFFKEVFNQVLSFFNFKAKPESSIKVVGINLPVPNSVSKSDSTLELEETQDSAADVISESNSTLELENTQDQPATEAELNSLLDSINSNISDVKTAIGIELEETQDPDLEMIDELATKIQNALQEEMRDWKKIDLLIRQLSILIVQQMAKNDQKTIQQELELLLSDIERVRKTYNTKWELTLAIAIGTLGILGGLGSLGGGAGAIAGTLSSGFLTNLKYITDGVSLLNQGLNPFNQIIKNTNESKRALYNFELERNRGYKSASEASLQNARSARSGMLSQSNNAIDAAYRAFISLAGG